MASFEMTVPLHLGERHAARECASATVASQFHNKLKSTMKTPARILTTLLFAAIASFVLGLALSTPINARSRPPMIAWLPSANGTFDYGMVNIEQTVSQQFTLTNSGGSASGMLSISHLQ